MSLLPPLPTSIVPLLIVLYVAWSIITIARRVLTHPLSRFPGPKLAAASAWYRAYVELWEGASMTTKLAEWHAQYGEVVRVGPNELHFSNPQAYSEIYSRRFAKEKTLYTSFGEDESSFGYLTVSEAKARRDLMNPLFSRREILSLQTLIQSKIDKLCNFLSAQFTTNKPVDLFFALRCLTTDITTAFCFANSLDALDAPGFRAPLVLAMEATLPSFLLFRHFPAVRKAVFSMPDWMTLKLSPQMEGLVELQRILRKQIEDVVMNPKSLKKAPHRTMYHQLIVGHAEKSEQEPISKKSLYEEGQALMFAGIDTSSNVLMLGIFYVLKDAEIHRKLLEELMGVWKELENQPGLEVLESCRYLTAVINESLRIAPGVAASKLRIVGPEPTTISSHEIPAGTVIGMSSIFVHRNPTLFPNPSHFDPSRWLPEGPADINYLVPFSKGPRACLGRNLAYCELYLAFATLFRRFEMTLDGTTERDLAWKECFLPWYTGRHLHVRAKVRSQ